MYIFSFFIMLQYFVCRFHCARFRFCWKSKIQTEIQWEVFYDRIIKPQLLFQSKFTFGFLFPVLFISNVIYFIRFRLFQCQECRTNDGTNITETIYNSGKKSVMFRKERNMFWYIFAMKQMYFLKRGVNSSEQIGYCKHSIFWCSTSYRNGNKISNNSFDFFKLITRRSVTLHTWFCESNVINRLWITVEIRLKSVQIGYVLWISVNCLLNRILVYFFSKPPQNEKETHFVNETMTELTFLFHFLCKLTRKQDRDREKQPERERRKMFICDKINIVLSSCRSRCELIDKYNVNSLFNCDAVRLIFGFCREMFIQCRRSWRVSMIKKKFQPINIQQQPINNYIVFNHNITIEYCRHELSSN